MDELKAQQPVLTAVIEIKRAATGQVEQHTLVLTPLPEKPAEQAECDNTL